MAATATRVDLTFDPACPFSSDRGAVRVLAAHPRFVQLKRTFSGQFDFA